MNKFFTLFIALVLPVLVFAQEEKPVRFVIKNAGVNVKGSFSKMDVQGTFDPENPSTASFTASIDVSTLDTGIKGRDKHLKKEKYFDLENYPKIHFKSTSVSQREGQFLLKGKLKIKSTEREVEIPFSYKKEETGNWLEGYFEIDRRDYSVGKKHLIMGSKVKITIRYKLS